MIPFLIVLFAAVVVAAMIFSAIQAKKRREAIAAWAASVGLAYTADKDYSFDSRYPQFGLLCEGSNRYAFNIVTGTHTGRGVCAFDYHYETHSTDSKGNRETHHHYFSAVVVDANLPLKPLVIRPEGIFDKVAAFMGFGDINFESAEFSRKFCVKSPDRKWAYDVIQQSTMEFLLAAPLFTIEFAGEEIIVARHGTFEVAAFEAAMAVADGVLARMPGYLVKQMTQPT